MSLDFEELQYEDISKRKSFHLSKVKMRVCSMTLYNRGYFIVNY